MPTRRDVLNRNQTVIDRAEDRAVRDVAQAYNAARRELVDDVLSRWTAPGTLTPGQSVDLMRSLGIIQRIDDRLLALEDETGQILRGAVTSSTELALEQIERETALLPREMRPNLAQFTQIDTRTVERFVPIAMDDLQGIRQTTALQLRRELQSGLIQGESFPNLVNRLMAATPTGEGAAVWRNGQLSAERMVRRTVVTANNQSKVRRLEQINEAQEREGHERVQKQAVAVIGPRTTDTCLQVHGQIVDVDKPFTLTGSPRFADEMMSPAFHWNCRTSTAMYHPSFESGGLNTSNMRSSANAERRNRQS